MAFNSAALRERSVSEDKDVGFRKEKYFAFGYAHPHSPLLRAHQKTALNLKE
jgi:hypothetical protein